jgi:hypothetical protein
MNVWNYCCYPFEGRFVSGSLGAHHGVVDPRGGQLGQVVDDSGPIFTWVNEVDTVSSMVSWSWPNLSQ